MGSAEGTRVPVSIVCVFNDLDVLETCLKRSIAEGMAAAPSTEFIAVDNRSGTYSTAGAALNHGAAAARNDVVVFVHQDVVLHSLPELEATAATVMANAEIGILGSIGVDRAGRVIGRMRDRIVLIGDPAPRPVDIDTLDEVLFMVARDRVLADPLSTDPELAWHAYAVEYALRMRAKGKRAVAMDILLTHNSLTTNLSKLDVAHRHVGQLFPQYLPIHTTCGTIRGGRPSGFVRNLRRIRGLGVWWRESVTAWQIAGPLMREVVIADLRVLIDQAADLAGAQAIHARDIAGTGATRSVADNLVRLGRSFDAATTSLPEADRQIDALGPRELLVITNLTWSDLRNLDSLAAHPHVTGVWNDTGVWVLVGIAATRLRPLWPDRRNRPFGGLLPARPAILGGSVSAGAKEGSAP